MALGILTILCLAFWRSGSCLVRLNCSFGFRGLFDFSRSPLNPMRLDHSPRVETPLFLVILVTSDALRTLMP